VRKGSFGYRTRGKSFELVAGSILVGHPGDEYNVHASPRRSASCAPFTAPPESHRAGSAGQRKEIARFSKSGLPPALQDDLIEREVFMYDHIGLR